MSKRKSRAKSMFLDKTDIQFPDDSDPDLDIFTKPKVQVEKVSKESKATGSRTSARGKKEKKIYDPSESNGSVPKKKKDELASAKKMILSPSKTASPGKTAQKMSFPSVKTPQKLTVTKRKLDLDKDLAEIRQEKIQKLAATPSKRLLKEKTHDIEPAPAVPQFVQDPINKPLKSILRRSVSLSPVTPVPIRDFSTTEVSKWSPQDVSEYFIRRDFDTKDALKFKEEEIDGEALLILQRDDLKNLNLKVGIFVKMWNHVLRLQAGNIRSFKTNYSKFELIKINILGKNDPTQSWN